VGVQESEGRKGRRRRPIVLEEEHSQLLLTGIRQRKTFSHRRSVKRHVKKIGTEALRGHRKTKGATDRQEVRRRKLRALRAFKGMAGTTSRRQRPICLFQVAGPRPKAGKKKKKRQKKRDRHLVVEASVLTDDRSEGGTKWRVRGSNLFKKKRRPGGRQKKKEGKPNRASREENRLSATNRLNQLGVFSKTVYEDF